MSLLLLNIVILNSVFLTEGYVEILWHVFRVGRGYAESEPPTAPAPKRGHPFHPESN
jgi:hypothetical protein